MNEYKMITLHLRGAIAQQFGSCHTFLARHFNDVLAWLKVNFPTTRDGQSWDSWLSDRTHWGFRVVTSEGVDFGVDEFNETIPDAITLKIVHTGAGGFLNSGIFKIILGAALIAAGAFTGNIPLAFVGAGLLLKGVVQLLKPGTEKNESKSISGSPNNVSADSVVPVGFGKFFASPLLVSGEIVDSIR